MTKWATRFGRLIRLGLILVLGICALAFGTGQAQTINDVLAGIAMRVPAFAGVHVDEQQDVIYVHLRNGTPAMAQAVLAQLRIAFGDQNLRQHRVQVVPATFGFSELKRWHDRMAMNVLDLPGVTFTGIDHANNQLVIGMENSTVRSSVEPELASLRIPRQAVSLMETGPIEFNGSLSDLRRPVVGGIEIGTPVGTCSLGFNAQRSGVAGFVTASHCSNKDDVPPGTVGTVYTQPDDGVSRIGVETVDPGFHGCFCFFGFCAFTCRSSDSAFVKLDSPASSALGLIARPLGSETTEWDGVSTFRIEGGGSPFTGLSVTKVGRTTGRTDGTVLLTGLTIPILKTSFPFLTRKLLQDQVAATFLFEPGDSGSPVIHTTGTDNASLEGLGWGGLGKLISGAPGALFSPISGVRKDLGPLTFVASSFADLVPVSPPGSTNFCEITSGRRVKVRVANIGGAPAPMSFTRVDFPGFGPVPPGDNPTPMISQGGSYDISPIDLPAGCFNPDCNFVITVDVNNQVDEGPTGEGNNTVTGSCPG